ncbi:Protein required for ethanol metabolism [Savitreella phatthalungensis]
MGSTVSRSSGRSFVGSTSSVGGGSLYRVPREALLLLFGELLVLVRLWMVYSGEYHVRPLLTTMVTNASLTALSDTIAQCVGVVVDRLRQHDYALSLRYPADSKDADPVVDLPPTTTKKTTHFDAGDDVEVELGDDARMDGDAMYEDASRVVAREMLRGAERRFDWERCGRFWTWGFMSGGLQYWWFDLLDRFLGGPASQSRRDVQSAVERAYFATPGRPDDRTLALLAQAYAADSAADAAGRGVFSGSGITSVLKRVVADQSVYAPLSLLLFFLYMGLCDGALTSARGHFKRKLAKEYPVALRAQYLLWPAVQLCNFAIVPLEYQIPVVGAFSVGWNLYLSLYFSSGSGGSAATVSSSRR